MNRRYAKILVPLLAVLLFPILPQNAYAQPRAADPSLLVQQAANGCNPCAVNPTITVSFPSSVTSGDVVVVAVMNVNPNSCGCVGAFVPTDSLGSSYTRATSIGVSFATVDMSFATLSSGGADTITVVFSGSPPTAPTAANVYIYEVSGVSTTSAIPQRSESDGTSSPTSTTSTTFTPGAFLIAEVETGSVITALTPGTGFTLSPQSPATSFGGAEFSTSGVSSPTTFPVSFSPAAGNWAEASTEFEPIISASPSSTSIERGNTATSTITLISTNGFSGPISLTATIAPAGPKTPTVSLSPTSVMLPSGGSTTTTLTITAPHSPKSDGTYTITVTATSGFLSHTATVSLTVTKT